MLLKMAVVWFCLKKKKKKYGYVNVSLQKWQRSQRLVFTLSQVSGTLVRVFMSLAWSRYDEKLY